MFQTTIRVPRNGRALLLWLWLRLLLRIIGDQYQRFELFTPLHAVNQTHVQSRRAERSSLIIWLLFGAIIIILIPFKCQLLQMILCSVLLIVHAMFGFHSSNYGLFGRTLFSWTGMAAAASGGMMMICCSSKLSSAQYRDWSSCGSGRLVRADPNMMSKVSCEKWRETKRAFITYWSSRHWSQSVVGYVQLKLSASFSSFSSSTSSSSSVSESRKFRCPINSHRE
jgi:hypothetical protein